MTHFFFPIACVTDFKDTAGVVLFLFMLGLLLIVLLVLFDVPEMLFWVNILMGLLTAIDANEAVCILLITAVPGLAPLNIENITIGVRI